MTPSRFPRRTTARSLLVLVALGGSAAAEVEAQDNVPEGMILEVARAKQLARMALDDLVLPLGTLLIQLGPSTVYAGGQQGPGTFSIAVGGAGGALTLTNPDYTQSDAAGNPDQIEAGVGAAYADVSIGLVEGSRSGRAEGIGSVDLLARLGYTIGDQTDIDDEVDFGSLKPIFGFGARLGVVKGAGLPAISIAAGINVFQKRTFGVQDTVEGTDFEVALDLEQTTKFALLEVGKQVGFFTPFLAAGISQHRLEAEYLSEVVYDPAPAPTVDVQDKVDIDKVEAVLFGGFEVGGGFLRLALQGGVVGSDPFGTAFIRVTK